MSEQALSDIKGLDFSHCIAGPYCTKLLADYGAEVIKVEKPGAGDGARNFGPFPGDIPHRGKSGLFLHLNTNKRGIFQEAYQEDTGAHLYPAAPFKMSETPAKIRRGPVRLGEDNEYVYKTLLKFTDAEYAELEGAGHIGMDFSDDIP